MNSTAWRNVALLNMIIASLSVMANLAMFRWYVSRPPFLLTITPDANGATVQFIQALGLNDKMVVSPKFHVGVDIAEPFQVALDSPHCSIPKAVIEFWDTTLLPGRFRIRFGETVIDVLSSTIIVDGNEYDWLEKPPAQEPTAVVAPPIRQNSVPNP